MSQSSAQTGRRFRVAVLVLLTALVAAVVVATVVIGGALSRAQDARAFERCMALHGITPDNATQRGTEAMARAAELCSD